MIYYDLNSKETIVILDNQRLTIPDYMKISDIQYFIADKEYQSLIRTINETSYKTEQESPLDRAKAHYKELGWFKDGDSVHGQN